MSTTTSPSRYAIGAFDALSAQVAILDARGELLAVNRAWTQFAEDNGGTVTLGVNYLEICRRAGGEDRVDALAVSDGIERVITGDLAVFEWEYPCHSERELRYFIARVTRFDQDGQVYVLVAHENITRRKLAELEVRELNTSLERRVRERTREVELSRAVLEVQNRQLEVRNAELAQFASVAAHDLQEPLRTLSLHADVLLERHAELEGGLDERARRSLRYIVEHARRARRLVRDILAIADIGDVPALEVVSVNALVPNLLDALDWPAASPLHLGALPEVQASPAQLRQLLSNLLGNALKFAGSRPLDVSLRGWRDGVMVEFALEDAGIGIPEGGLERAFEMFRRLHGRDGRDDTEGSGIGLALCRKIVTRHHGRIWLEGNDRGGTTVRFTLPSPDYVWPRVLGAG